MARLRFPGRPGHRFGRLGVRYGVQGNRQNEDNSERLIANIHSSLRKFHELVGESDEDEEFEGFTQDDISQTSMRLKSLEAVLAEEKRALAQMAVVEQKKYWPKSTQFFHNALKEGHAQPAKVSVHSRVLEAERTRKSSTPVTTRSPIKLKFKMATKLKDEKIRLKKMKEKARLKKLKEKSKIKKLKEKEKKKMKAIKKKIRKLKKKEGRVEVEEEVATLPSSPKIVSKVKPVVTEQNSVAMGFVLPSQSNHSSRKIIPNKRLTDYDDGFFPIKRIKTPVAEPVIPLPVDVKPAERDGKRERKPSSRMADMMCEDIVKRKKMKKSSKSILQKAKFRLNQSAINKSKKALAKSLKRKMSRVAAQYHDMPTSPGPLTLESQGMQTAFGKNPIDLQSSCIAKVGSKRLKGAVFGMSSLPAIPKYALKTTTEKLPSFKKPLEVKSCYVCKDTQQKYFCAHHSEHPTCRSCRRFFLQKSKLVATTGVRFVCDFEGNCEVDLSHAKNVACVACRFKRASECFGAYDPRDMVKEKEIEQIEPAPLEHAETELDTAPDPGGTLVTWVPEEGTPMPEEEGLPPFNEIPFPPPPVDEVASPPEKEGCPRIKHVCRKASVALGRAHFPGQSPQLRLSALPDQEKLLQMQENGASDSDDMTMDEIIQHAPEKADMVSAQISRKIRTSFVQEKDDESEIGAKRSVNPKRSRTMRCKKCSGCRESDCRKCIFCLDMPKNGGSGRLKKACIRRRCQNPVRYKASKTAYLAKKRGPARIIDSEESDEFLSEDNMEYDGSSSEEEFIPSPYVRPVANKLSPMKMARAEMKIAEKKSVTGRRVFTKVNVPSPRRQLRSKFQGVQGKVTPTPLTDVNHRLKLEFNGELSVEAGWQHGLALVSSNPLCMRSVCYLCGSGGKNQLIFCCVCCEPFHSFCLDKGERPLADNLENWCCRKCQFCRVCGRGSNNLLQCIQCQDAYHPSQTCLQKYPNKPSKNRRIWVCPKCVKCKSCGATTPGTGPEATWMYDFSLCHSCGMLMSKGNFCPVCHKCYADDDWDCKMMQCSTCESWVHAKCEGLTDEMYSIMSYLPEDVQYHCPRCSNVRPAPWMRVIKQEMSAGMLVIINAMMEGRRIKAKVEEVEVEEEVNVEEVEMKEESSCDVDKPLSVKCDVVQVKTEIKLKSALDDIISFATSPEKEETATVKVHDPETDLPRDLKMILRKQSEGRYVTVTDFVDDVARILQLSGDPSSSWLKVNAIVRSIFQKKLLYCFPWFNIKTSKFWSSRQAPLPDGMLPDAVVPPSDDHTYHQWLQREAPPLSPQPSVYKSPTKSAKQEDTRVCVLCSVVGDCPPGDEGRLLYAGADDWVHVNCGLWSAETYENDDGVLINIHMAITRGRKLKCDMCSKPGPTVGCCHATCSANFHFMCARKSQCSFQFDKRVFCRVHWYACTDECIRDNKFSVSRRSCVDAFSSKWLKSRAMQKGLLPSQVNLLCGSLTVDTLGVLSMLSDGPRFLSPVDYCSSRVYWSTQDARRRCVYTFRITEAKPVLPPVEQVFTRNLTITHDKQHPDYDAELEQNFRAMLSPVQRKRLLSDTPDTSLSAPPPETKYRKYPVQDIKEEIRQLVQGYKENTASREKSATFRRLSKNTIKLLGPNAVQLINRPQVMEEPACGALTAIAKRLNAAAAKSRTSREGSTDSSRRSSSDEKRDFALSTDGMNDDQPKKKSRQSAEPCTMLSAENLSLEANGQRSVLNGSAHSHSDDAELSTSDYSDTDIDLCENYGDPDETSCDSDVRIIPCSVSLTRVEDMPLHAKLAEKIKAESLAHSATSEQGPFKCGKCKRLYRTHDSWRVHDKTCDFVVTSSEDESEHEETPKKPEETTPKKSSFNNNTDSDDDLIVVEESPEPKVTNIVIKASPEKEEICINIGPEDAAPKALPQPAIIHNHPRIIRTLLPNKRLIQPAVSVNPADIRNGPKALTNVKLPDGNSVKVMLSPEHLKRLNFAQLPQLLQMSTPHLVPPQPALISQPVMRLVSQAPVVTVPAPPPGPVTYVMPKAQMQPQPQTVSFNSLLTSKQQPIRILQRPINRMTLKKPTLSPRKGEAKTMVHVTTAMQPKGLPSVKFAQSMKKPPSSLQCLPIHAPSKKTFSIQKIQKVVHAPFKVRDVKAKKPTKKSLMTATVSESPPHPLIHPQHQHLMLPAPNNEEEVTDSPLMPSIQEPPTPHRSGSKGNSPYLIYEITSDDGFCFKSESIEEAWQKLAESIQEARSNARMKQLSYSALGGADMFGLTNATVMYLLEQLYGAHRCKQYFFRYIRYEHDDNDFEPDINPSGSARSEAFSSRKPFEMFSFLLSKYRPFPKPSVDSQDASSSRRAPSQDLPMSMRYRYLKTSARDTVGVHRSLIHGRGLFSKRYIDTGDMIVEYAGNVIRSSLTDSREKYYETKGIGCYMFRIDEHWVIDATVNGNAARFINHSCEPNCFSRVIDVGGVKHIIIFASKVIRVGEELTYDYKFPYEEVKIPCSCQAKRCRKYLN